MTYAGHHPAGAMPARYAVSGGNAATTAPGPQRTHWSTWLFAAGMGIAFVALLATLVGIPGRMGYDIGGPGRRTDTDSDNPLTVMRSLDQNMKWVADASGDDYVGRIKAINRKEAAIPEMITAIGAMESAVRAIDSGLGSVQETTTRMNADMSAMTAASRRSGASMEQLGAASGLLSRSMLSLADSTQRLTQGLASIETGAKGIADEGTSQALTISKELNAVLPQTVPDPVYEEAAP